MWDIDTANAWNKNCNKWIETPMNKFKIEFGNTSVGVANDSETFRRYYEWVFDPTTWNSTGNLVTFSTSENNLGEAIRTPFMDWHYWPEKMWNIILRELILDTEAAVQGRVYITAMFLQGEIFRSVKESLENNSQQDTAGFVFNTLPGKIHVRCKISGNKVLWKKVAAFYSEVRNCLMHWKQATNANKEVIQEIFFLYREIYEWLDQISLDIAGNPTTESSILPECFPELCEESIINHRFYATFKMIQLPVEIKLIIHQLCRRNINNGRT